MRVVRELTVVEKSKILVVVSNPSEIKGLCLMKWPSKTLQNLPYFWNMKTHVHIFFVFYFELYFITVAPYECPDLYQHSLGGKIIK